MHNIFLTSIDNLSTGKLYDGGRHYGFNQSLSTLKEEIIKDEEIWVPFVNDPLPTKTLYITGHSKGGALATGAAVDFANFFKDKASRPQNVTYTFEAARFFTAKGESDENNKPLLDTIWRFEYQYDIVPHVPLGEVTKNFLLDINTRSPYSTLFPKIEGAFGLSANWIENNNINFVPAGNLAYVGRDGKLSIVQPVGDHYKDRFFECLKEMVKNMLHIKNFVLDQHSNCYLSYLKAKVMEVAAK